MKYAAIVLTNQKNPLSSVDYQSVTDAFLSGGVFLDETIILPYDAPSAVSGHITRLSEDHDGIFIVCDGVLADLARKTVDELPVSGGKFEGVLKETREHIFGVIPAGEEGAKTVSSEVVPRIDRRRNQRYCRVVLGVAAASDERIQRALSFAERAAEGKLFLHARGEYGLTRIEAVYNRETPKMIADEVVRVLASELREYLFTVNGETLPSRLVDALKLRRMKISTAESFTGGGVGGAIVSVPGASAVFYEGINAYDVRAKRARLGVSEFTIQNKGAVSDETAYEMAAGLITGGNCDLAIATMGVAGPDSDGSGTPAGTCYIAVGTKSRIRVFRYDLIGNRETVTKTAINFALFHAYEEIK